MVLINLPQDMDQYRAHLSTVMKLRRGFHWFGKQLLVYQEVLYSTEILFKCAFTWKVLSDYTQLIFISFLLR
jgi:hypothetical protein